MNLELTLAHAYLRVRFETYCAPRRFVNQMGR
jgi:hypothetical protein